MLEKMVIHLNLSDIYQCIRKCFIVGLTLVGICSCVTGCGAQGLANQQIDEIIIYTSHYARTPVEVTVSITDEDQIEGLVTFFEEMESREMTSEDTPIEKYDGGGWDVIEFRKDGKIIKQYTLSGKHICEEEPGSSYINANSDESYTDMMEKIQARTWHIISQEDESEWVKYIESVRSGTLGSEIK